MQCRELKTSSSGVRIFVARDRADVLRELRNWSRRVYRRDPRITRIGLFGSYATGNYGPGSDLDILIIVDSSEETRWFLRSAAIDVRGLSIGADIFVYTVEETARLEKNSLWFQSIMREIVWLGEES
jgi:predicted nucleotidyltransferase